MITETLVADGTVETFEARDGFTTEIRVEPGHAIRRTKADGQDYGIHSMGLRFLLHGPAATVQFLMWTGIVPETVDGAYGKKWRVSEIGLMAADLGYHADAAQYEGQWGPSECDVRDGECFYDGSGLAAEPLLELALKRGDGAVFRALQEYYDERDFDGTVGRGES